MPDLGATHAVRCRVHSPQFAPVAAQILAEGLENSRAGLRHRGRLGQCAGGGVLRSETLFSAALFGDILRRQEKRSASMKGNQSPVHVDIDQFAILFPVAKNAVLAAGCDEMAWRFFSAILFEGSKTVRSAEVRNLHPEEFLARIPVTASGRPIHDENAQGSGNTDETRMGNLLEEQAMQILPFPRSLQRLLGSSQGIMDPLEAHFLLKPAAVPPLPAPESKNGECRLRNRCQCWSLIV